MMTDEGLRCLNLCHNDGFTWIPDRVGNLQIAIAISEFSRALNSVEVRQPRVDMGHRV